MRAAQAGHRYGEWKVRQAPRIVTISNEVSRAPKLLLSGAMLACPME